MENHNRILDTVVSRRGFIGGVAATLASVLATNALGKDFFVDDTLNVHNISLPKSKTIVSDMKFGVITDLHIADWNMDIVDRTIRQVNTMNLDFLTIVGDISEDAGQGDIDILDQLKIHTIVVPGNHDYECDRLDHRLKAFFLKRKNFVFLHNQKYTLGVKGNTMEIAGMGSLLHNDFPVLGFDDKSKNYKFLLTHEPGGFLKFENADLSAAGHTHGASKTVLEIMRLFGMTPMTDEDVKFNKGLVRRGNRYFLTSNGIGKGEMENDIHHRASTPSIDVIQFS